MIQNEFDFARARRTDPVSSSQAAAVMNETGSALRHAAQIIIVMQRAHRPVTAVEIADEVSNFDRIEVTRRLSGLCKIGAVYKCGIKKHGSFSYTQWALVTN